MKTTHAPFRVGTPAVHERDALLALAVDTGRFTSDEADGLLGGVLDGYAAGALGDEHQVWVLRDAVQEAPIGWSYFAPDAYSDGVWNLWWIGVHPSHHGTGAGRALLHAVESHVRDTGARVLVIETSDAQTLMRARRFYEREGYVARGTIPYFYAPGEGKVVFSRSLQA